MMVQVLSFTDDDAFTKADVEQARRYDDLTLEDARAIYDGEYNNEDDCR